MLIGHPEHDLLFIATQVARAAGLKNPKASASNFRTRVKQDGFIQVKSLVHDSCTLKPSGIHAPIWPSVWLSTESTTYEMLAKGNAPQSQQFRDWVFKEVLPSIRKTGSYNVNESTTETGQQFAGELAALNDAVSGLLKQNATILGMLRRRQRGDAG